MDNANANVCKLIGDFHALRSASFGLGGTIGADFARESAREWKERGIPGLASACFNLAHSLLGVPGSYDVYSHALLLARSFAAEAVKS